MIFLFIKLLCEVLTICILLRVIVSWVSPGQTNMLTKTLYHLTEPLLAPLRRIVPRVGILDFTPFVAVVILQLIMIFLP